MAEPATREEQATFIRRMVDAIEAQPTLYGLYPSVMIAQAALESGWGKSRLSNPYNNYFGVKASGTQYSSAWNPHTSPTVNLDTLEYDSGYNSQVATWRVYGSITDSLRDRNALVANNPRYRAALSASSPTAQVEALKQGGYATEPEYVSRVMSVVKKHNLTQYDGLKPKGTASVDTATVSRVHKIQHQIGKTIIAVLVIGAVVYGGYRVIKKLK